MDLSFYVRKANVDDAVGIAIVQAYTWLTTYAGLLPDEVLQSRVESVPVRAQSYAEQIPKNDSYIVAECGGTVVGFAAYSAARNEDYPDDGEVQAIYVLKGFQRQGVGRQIFERCLFELREKGYSHVILNCLDGNPSLGFYQKMGGVIVGERMDALGGGHMITEKILRFEI